MKIHFRSFIYRSSDHYNSQTVQRQSCQRKQKALKSYQIWYLEINLDLNIYKVYFKHILFQSNEKLRSLWNERFFFFFFLLFLATFLFKAKTMWTLGESCSFFISEKVFKEKFQNKWTHKVWRDNTGSATMGQPSSYYPHLCPVAHIYIYIYRGVWREIKLQK